MKTYVIAEVGPNHNGDLNKALKYVKTLSKTGCNAIKFQHGNPSKIYSNQSFFPNYQDDFKKNFISPQEAAKKRLLKNKDHVLIYKECVKNKIDYLCSAFDLNSLKFLNENTKLKYFKIPSGEILSIDMLNYIRKFDKPIILSTGMATEEEIEFSINFLNRDKVKNITLLHCISSYPTNYRDINLQMIKKISDKYDMHVGISDHTTSIDIAGYSIFLGSKIVEKHVTFDRNDIGPDHKTSLEIEEFSKMIKNIRRAELIYGSGIRKFIKNELNVKKASRKSITAKYEIPKGEIISKSKITFKRPGTGISPMEIEKIIKRKAKKTILKNDIIKWDDVI